jgi:LysM repeat protein
MAYDFYLDKTRLPITPSKLQVNIKGQNKTITLIDEGEINILKKPGLTEISFTALFPNVEYPFSSGNAKANTYLDELERLKTLSDEKGKFLPFQFIVSRVLPSGKVLFDTNIKVALEDYKIIDDAKNGFDMTVDITLKQYKSYGTKVVAVKPPTPEQPKATATVETTRPADNPPAQQSHTVVKGDCLWNIAQKYLGNGSRYPEIYELNKATIDGKNAGTGNIKYTIYPGQVLIMPK